jgi:alpha-galactosidase
MIIQVFFIRHIRPAGSRNLVEPAIQVMHVDGNTSLDLQYVSHNTKKTGDNISLTSVLLKDPVYPFEVTLYYKVYQKEDVVEQWSVDQAQRERQCNAAEIRFCQPVLFS